MLTTGAPIEAQIPKNRYASNPRNADWTIAQDWPSYTSEEHDRWNRLFAAPSGAASRARLRGGSCRHGEA